MTGSTAQPEAPYLRLSRENTELRRQVRDLTRKVRSQRLEISRLKAAAEAREK